MKLLKTINYIVIVLALVSSFIIVSANSGRGGSVFVSLPYIVLLWLLYDVVYKKFSEASQIAYFIASVLACVTSTYSYYEATYLSTSSTAALTFLIVPVTSLFLMLIIFFLTRAVISLIWYPDQSSNAWRTILITFTVIFILRNLSAIHSVFAPADKKPKDKFSFTKGDILKAKKLGVFVKDLHYKVDSFTGPVTFHPYIEKAFKYVDDDSIKIQLIKDRFGSYSLGFQKKAIGDGLLETVNFHECEFMPCLRKPQLDDTIIFNIKRFGYVVGTIKVWD
ncbi:MAG: hypothetical protein M3040_13490 [Bacteroidota bacterium]|nr:hypothetical protein [Bacteroidota bacterium]